MLYQEALCLSLGDRLVISEGWKVFPSYWPLHVYASKEDRKVLEF